MHSIVANCLGICLTLGQFVIFFVFRKDEVEDITNSEEKTTTDIVKEKEEEIKNQPEFMNEFI